MRSALWPHCLPRFRAVIPRNYTEHQLHNRLVFTHLQGIQCAQRFGLIVFLVSGRSSPATIRFRAVIPRNYTEHQRIQAFISKLPVNLQHSLNLRQPATFSQAVRIAKELEAPLRYSKQKVIGALTASAGVNQDGDGAQQEDVDFLGRTKEQRQIVKLLKKTEHLEATIMAFVPKLGPLLDSLCTYCGKHGHPRETCWILNPDLKPKGFGNTRSPQRDKGKEKVNKTDGGSISVSEFVTRLKEARELALENYRAAQEQQKKRYDSTRGPDTFEVGDLVWLYTPQVAAKRKKKLAMLWRGPYRVIDKTSDVNRKVQHLWNDKETQLIHVDRLKKAYNPYLVPRTALKVSADEEDRQVDQIVGEQVQGGDRWFLVQWKGHTDGERSWVADQPALAEFIRAYEAGRRGQEEPTQQPRKRGRPRKNPGEPPKPRGRPRKLDSRVPEDKPSPTTGGQAVASQKKKTKNTRLPSGTEEELVVKGSENSNLTEPKQKQQKTTTNYKNRQNESGRNRKQPQSEEKIMDFQTRKTADDDAKEDKEEPKEVEIKAKVKRLAKRRKRNIAGQRNETNGEIRQEQQAEDFNERSTTEKRERMNEDEEATQRVISEKKISAEPNRYDRRKKETSAEPNCDKNDEKKSAEPIEQDKEAKNSVMELAVEECSRTNTCLKGGRVMVSSHKSTRIESAASESSSDQPSTAEYDDMEKQERITENPQQKRKI